MERYISGAPSSFSGGGGGSGGIVYYTGGIVYTAGNDLVLSGTTFSLTDTIDVKDITAVDISGLGLYNFSGDGILINNSGFVGINLSGATPTHHLDVSGNVRITGNLTANQFVGNLSGDNISGNTIYASNQFVGDLSGHHIYGTNISGVNITATQFLGNLSGDNISGVNITATDISSNHIYGHSISGVNITASDISSNHIYGTNISGVNITATDISSNYIYGTNISGAGVVNTSGAMTSDTKLATSKAIRDYVNSVIALIAATTPLTSTYDDTTNTLTLAVDTGKEATKLLKVGSADITANQFIKMEADGDVVGVNSGIASGNLLKVKDGVSLTNGQFVKIDSGGEIISAVPPDTQPLDANGVQTAMNTIIEKEAITNNTLIKFNGTTKMTLGELGGDSIASFTTTELAGDTLVCDTTLRSNQSTTATSGDFLLKRNTTEKLRFGNALTTLTNDITLITGKLGIAPGTSNSPESPIATLQVGYVSGNVGNGTDWRYFHKGSGTTLGDYGSSLSCSIYADRGIASNGYIIATAGVMSSSDDRIKTEEIPIENATDTLLKITPKNYYKHPSYKVSEENEAPIPEKDLSGNVIEKYWESGVIAQQVAGIDELAHLIIIDDYKDVLNINYTGLIPFLIKSIQELNARIITLENRN